MESGARVLSSATALIELDRVRRVVRSRSRWYGRFLLFLAGGTVAYYAAVDVVPATPRTRALLGLGWTAFVVLLASWSYRQPVTRRGLRRFRAYLMGIYFLLIAATLLLARAVGDGSPGQWALGLVPALPCLVGAWMVLRR